MAIFLALLLFSNRPQDSVPRLRLHPWGRPHSDDTALILLQNTAYDCGWSPRLKISRWAAYFYTPARQRFSRRNHRFVADPRLSPGLGPTPADYHRQFRRDLEGFDRGHLAPDAALKAFGFRAQFETYYLTNITPQYSRTNRGPWRQIEEQIRHSVRPGETIWVVVGPVLFAGRDTHWLGPGRVAVPHAYFAGAVRKNAPVPTAWLVPNLPRPPNRPIPFWQVPVDSVERLTGIRLFPAFSRQPSH